MIIYAVICGRGRCLRIHERELHRDVLVYFSWAKIRHGVRERQISFESTDTGGLAFLVSTPNRCYGWRLQGPVQHFEY